MSLPAVVPYSISRTCLPAIRGVVGAKSTATPRSPR